MNTRHTIPTCNALLHPGTEVALLALLLSGESQVRSSARTASGSQTSVTGSIDVTH